MKQFLLEWPLSQKKALSNLEEAISLFFTHFLSFLFLSEEEVGKRNLSKSDVCKKTRLEIVGQTEILVLLRAVHSRLMCILSCQSIVLPDEKICGEIFT